MYPPTLRQGQQVINLLLQKNVDDLRLQRMFETGLLADFLEIEPEYVDRACLQQAIAQNHFDVSPETYTLNVSYAVPLNELVGGLNIKELDIDLNQAIEQEDVGPCVPPTATYQLVRFKQRIDGFWRAKRLIMWAGFHCADFRALITLALLNPTLYENDQIASWGPKLKKGVSVEYTATIGCGSCISCAWINETSDMSGRSYLVYKP